MSVDIKIQSSGWEVRALGNRSTRITAMAVAPTQPAAGVTESGDFSQSDEDLASRGFSCHSTFDDLDLDQFISLHSKVRYNLFSTFLHLCRFSQPYLNHQRSAIAMHCIQQEPANLNSSSQVLR